MDHLLELHAHGLVEMAYILQLCGLPASAWYGLHRQVLCGLFQQVCGMAFVLKCCVSS